jgi:hypothetical protein
LGLEIQLAREAGVNKNRRVYRPYGEEKMMKKVLLLGVIVFVLVGVVLFAQKTEKSGYPFKVDKDVATAVFAKKTYDEVWGATLKALIALDYKTTTLEKDAGIIKAVDIQKPDLIP